MENDYKKKVIKACAIYLALFCVMAIAAFVKLAFFSGMQSFKGEGFFAFSMLLSGLFSTIFVYALYGILSRKHLVMRTVELGLVCFVFALTYVVCIFAESTSVYLMPIFLCAYLLAPLTKRKDTFAANLFCIFAIFISLCVKNHSVHDADALESGLSLYIMVIAGVMNGSIVVFALSYLRKRLSFILRGLAACLGTVFMIVSLDVSLFMIFSEGFKNAVEHLSMTLKWATIGIFSQLILTLLLQPLLEKAFTVLTNLRLIELTDHNSPLIKRLITEAPGTFNHALHVANFAEVCATAIGENPYLARAAAYYHDIGKLANPLFFKENQPEGNPHDDILPEVSAEIVRGHTTEGLVLCRQYKVPEQIACITIEHHGTMPISIFYDKAKRLSDTAVDVKEYSYSGQTPRSKIAAIIMICDSAEAAIRATETTEAEKANAIVSSLLLDRIKSGQFDDCPITMADLYAIKEAIISACGGVYHKRLKYPSPAKQ